MRISLALASIALFACSSSVEGTAALPTLKHTCAATFAGAWTLTDARNPTKETGAECATLRAALESDSDPVRVSIDPATLTVHDGTDDLTPEIEPCGSLVTITTRRFGQAMTLVEQRHWVSVGTDPLIGSVNLALYRNEDFGTRPGAWRCQLTYLTTITR